MLNKDLMRMLKNLCKYNNIHITQTFSSDSKKVLEVRCLKDTTTIEITNLTNNTILLFDNLEESAEALQNLMNELGC